MNYTRKQLISLCNKAIVPHDKWKYRDSAYAQRQVGELLVLLRDGCPFEILPDAVYPSDRIYIIVAFRNFNCFEEGKNPSYAMFYLPTKKALDESDGCDWY